MNCVNLQSISQACKDNGIAIGQTDLVRIVCTECAEQEVCPSNSVASEEAESVSKSHLGHGIAMNVHALGSES